VHPGLRTSQAPRAGRRRNAVVSPTPPTMDANLTVQIRYRNVRLALALLAVADRLPFLTPAAHGRIWDWVVAHVVRINIAR
jgi:hypothetical protein